MSGAESAADLNAGGDLVANTEGILADILALSRWVVCLFASTGTGLPNSANKITINA